jgi:RNA polymerase-binding protein DksA
MKFKKPAIERAKQKAKEIKRMSKEELKKFKTLLLREREQAGGDLSHIADSTLNKSARDASGDLSGYSYHMADQATDDYDRDFSLERATAEQRLLYSIDEALKRIDEGTYGNCLFCGTRISKRRLTALPHSECCIDCQKSKENK